MIKKGKDHEEEKDEYMMYEGGRKKGTEGGLDEERKEGTKEGMELIGNGKAGWKEVIKKWRRK